MTSATPARDELRRRLTALRRVRVLPPPTSPTSGTRELAKLTPLTITTRETNPHG